MSFMASTMLSFSPRQLFNAGEQGVWYDPSDLSTIFSDTAGTTPVTAVETAVGLIIDKRNPAYSVYFDGSSYLTSAKSWSIASSTSFTLEAFVYLTAAQANFQMICSDNNGNASKYVTINATGLEVQFVSSIGTIASITYTFSQNTWYHVAIVRNGTTVSIYVNGVAQTVTNNTQTASFLDQGTTLYIGRWAYNTSPNYFTGYISNFRVVNGTAVYTANFTPPTSPLAAVTNTQILTCGNSWSSNPTITNFGAKADKSNPFNTGTGNHATQSTSASRPVLSARVNVLTKSEALDHSDWTKTSMTATDGATDPNGGSTAETLAATGANGTVTQSITAVATDYVFSVWLKRKTGTGNVDITCHSGGTWVTQSITSSWAKYTVTQTLTAGSRTPGIRIVTSGDEVYAWGADLRVSNDGTGLPAYQRVNTSTDYDTAGFPYYLRFDGTDDRLATSSIDFSGTDKMTLWAGVRKLSDATEGWIVSQGSWSSSGQILLNAPPGGGGAKYGVGLRRALTSYYLPETFAAPISNVISVAFDAAATSLANLIKPRFNQTLNQTNGTYDNQSGVNLANSVLNIGSNGTSSHFNGRLYSLIVRGASSTTGQIADTEGWVNSRTRAF